MSIAKWVNRSMALSVFLGVSVIVLSILTSCTSSGVVHVSLLGHEKMNDERPCFVCLYKLKNNTNFLLVPLESFWKDGDKAFAADIVPPRTDIMLRPGETRWVSLEVSKETNYIGVAADFRTPDSKGWRLIFPLIVKRPDQILLTVVSNRIEIEKIK